MRERPRIRTASQMRGIRIEKPQMIYRSPAVSAPAPEVKAGLQPAFKILLSLAYIFSFIGLALVLYARLF